MQNGFCCEVGMFGIYNTDRNVAGTCVSSVPAGATAAILVSRRGLHRVLLRQFGYRLLLCLIFLQ
jgi:hypothetical protein